MNKNALVILVALASGCQSDLVPSNRVLGDAATLVPRIEKHCGLELFFEGSELQEAQLAVQITDQFGCRFPGNRTLIPVELRGEPQGRLRGYREVYSGGAICSIRLGPGPIAAPRSFEWIIDSIDDPLLAARIKHAIGTIDLRKQFTIAFSIDGVHVRYWQHAMGMFGTDPYVELLLDGCQRVPDDQIVRRDSEMPLRFDSDPPGD